MYIVKLIDNNFDVTHWGPYTELTDAYAFAVKCHEEFDYGFTVIPLYNADNIALMTSQRIAD